MKISCQSCQAKYTIADEKVLGKIVKIRCKKCGATIVINGNETGAATGASSGGEQAAAFDYAGGAASAEQWTVNVADGDQRTMTADEIAGAFRTGTVNDETYCWKDGMADWLPIREIPELQSLVGGGASPDATHQDQTAASFSGSPPADPHERHEDEATAAGYSGYSGGATNGNGNGAGLFGGGVAAAAAPAPEPAARRQGGRAGGGMDLFGGVAQAGAEDDVMTSAPAGAMPQAHNDDPGKLTGQRNENSVLFSLSALTQNAPKEEAPAAGGEGSGLIDIRALSASMGSNGPEKRNHADDIMNLGGGGAFSAALAAPVLAPPSDVGGGGMLDLGGGGQQKDNTKLILGGIIGAGALIALAIVLVFVLKKPEASPVPTPTAMPTDTTGAMPAGSGAVAQNDTAPTVTTTPAPTAPTPGGASAPGTGEAPSGDAPRSSGHSHHASGGGGSVGGGGAADTTPKYTPPPAAPAPRGGGSLDDALRNSVGGGGGGGGGAAPAPQSSAPFDRGAAAAALGSINVASCRKSDGPTGSGHIRVTFSPSGSVSSAVVDQPPFAGSAVGGCVAGKFRGAHIPAFGGAPVSVGKSFVIE